LSRLKLSALPPGDLLRAPAHLKLWSSIRTSSFGNPVMMLAWPLMAAVLLQASPTKMGLLTAIERSAFLLFSLPWGVCLAACAGCWCMGGASPWGPSSW
jgi:hypothetical protein